MGVYHTSYRWYPNHPLYINHHTCSNHANSIPIVPPKIHSSIVLDSHHPSSSIHYFWGYYHYESSLTIDWALVNAIIHQSSLISIVVDDSQQSIIATDTNGHPKIWLVAFPGDIYFCHSTRMEPSHPSVAGQAPKICESFFSDPGKVRRGDWGYHVTVAVWLSQVLASSFCGGWV